MNPTHIATDLIASLKDGDNDPYESATEAVQDWSDGSFFAHLWPSKTDAALRHITNEVTADAVITEIDRLSILTEGLT